MRFIKYFQAIYSDTKKHIMLFSIIGTVALLINNVLSKFTNNLLSNHLIVAPDSAFEIMLEIGFGILIWFYIFGYEYKFLNNIMNDSEIILPEFNGEVFLTACKMTPIFILWQIYFFILTFLTGIFTITTGNLLYYFLAGTVMLFITPFVFMIYVKFSKDFKYTNDVISPKTLLKYIDKSIVDVVFWCLEFGIYGFLFFALLIGYMGWALNLSEQIPRLIATLGGMCFAAYIFVIFKLIFGIGIAKIVKEKILTK